MAQGSGHGCARKDASTTAHLAAAITHAKMVDSAWFLHLQQMRQ